MAARPPVKGVKAAKVGKNCLISQQVTIGGRSGLEGAPIIGDYVRIGAGGVAALLDVAHGEHDMRSVVGKRQRGVQRGLHVSGARVVGDVGGRDRAEQLRFLAGARVEGQRNGFERGRLAASLEVVALRALLAPLLLFFFFKLPRSFQQFLSVLRLLRFGIRLDIFLKRVLIAADIFCLSDNKELQQFE